MGLHLVECLIKLGSTDKAVQELKNILQAYPTFSAARSKLGVVYYNSNRVAEAAEQWESVLNKDPQNDEVRGYLRIAQNTGITQL